MYIDYKLEGKYVNLRSVTEEDAEFILEIRNNPQISKYLPPLNVTIEQQRQWITKQRADQDSYYFLMTTPDGEPIGCISVYDIEGDMAETGRFCSFGDPYSNIEACVLLNDFCFHNLGLKKIHIWVYEGNKPVIALNKSFGYKWTETKTDDKGESFKVGILTPNHWIENREKVFKKLRYKS